MTLDEAARILRGMYDSAPRGSETLAVHLFGIRYGQEIRANGLTPSEIAEEAGLSKNWYAQVNDGINLASHVDLKDEQLPEQQSGSLYRVKYDSESRKMDWSSLMRKVPPGKGNWVKMDEQFSEAPPEIQNSMIRLIQRLVENR